MKNFVSRASCANTRRIGYVAEIPEPRCGGPHIAIYAKLLRPYRSTPAVAFLEPAPIYLLGAVISNIGDIVLKAGGVGSIVGVCGTGQDF